MRRRENSLELKGGILRVSVSLVVMVFLVACLVIVPLSTSAAQPQPQTNAGYLDLQRTYGPAGLDVNITGQVTEWPDQDQSCSISSPTDPAIINNGNSWGNACTVNGGSSTKGNITGSFTVGNVPPGQYVIEVTACAGNNGCCPSCGDWVQAVFWVQDIPTIDISPYGAYAGGSLQVLGSGFSLNDARSCSLAGVVVGTVVDCQISNGQLSAVFSVAAGIPSGYYELTAIGSTGDTANTLVGVATV